MLKSLLISNYALIDRSELDFETGFTVITGETGSGKSILLEALGLVLGNRANFNAIRKGQEKSVVEAVFKHESAALNERLEAEGLDVLSDILLRRELTTSGRSRAFINDSPVSVSLLHEVSTHLVDMHGQQENIALQSTQYQMQQLDLFAKTGEELSAYRQAFNRFKSTTDQLKRMKESAEQVRKDEDYFRFQFSELSEVELDAEAFLMLEEEMNELEHAEEIQRALSLAASALDGDDAGASQALRIAVNELKAVSNFSSSLQDLHDRLQSVFIEVEDVHSECARQLNSIESDPSKLGAIREKMDVFNRLMHKHNVQTVEALITIREEYGLKLQGIDSYDDELLKLTGQLDEYKKQLEGAANRLSKKRFEALKPFQTQLQTQVRKLGMEKAEVVFDLQRTDTFFTNGADQIDILFDANGNQRIVPLKESASGGEVARLMLALKSIIASADRMPTLIFDEVDTGVSGEVAKQIGKLMKSIAADAQIIAVTHLPGVASKGKHHVRIAKSEEKDQVVSRLEVLDESKRVEEIAAMFSGNKLTDASLESARLLLTET
ncbi:MAG: DNA repair protein RecN [Salibacteraceae bacterium]